MGLEAGSGILHYITHSKTRSDDPQGEVDVPGQHPAGVSLKHHQADLVIQSNPKSICKLIVTADDEVAGNNELLHICLQVPSSLEKKYFRPIGLKGVPHQAKINRGKLPLYQWVPYSVTFRSKNDKGRQNNSKEIY